MRRADHVRRSVQCGSGGLSYGRRFFLTPDGTPRSESAHGVRFLFTGREWLAPLGLYDYRHRADSPILGRFLQVDPIDFAGGDVSIYGYCDESPLTFVDPLGLWRIQFGDLKLGRGHPWMVFDRSSWGDLLRGAAATLDGIIPFADPLKRVYADECGDVDKVYKTSRFLGAIARDLLLAAAIPNIQTWARNPVLYEIGQKTLPRASCELLKHLGPIERGRALVAQQGWMRALVPDLTSAYVETIRTGLTPGGWLLTIGALEAADYRARN